MSETVDKKTGKRGQKGTLNAKQAAFCREYVKDYNAKQAFIRAGYAEKGARQGAGRLLTNGYVKAEIGRLEREKRGKDEVTREWVIAELKDNVRRCKQTTPVFDDDGEPIGEYRWEPAAANRALELLGKAINVFEGHQKAGAPQVTQLSDAELAERLEKAAQTLKGT